MTIETPESCAVASWTLDLLFSLRCGFRRESELDGLPSRPDACPFRFWLLDLLYAELDRSEVCWRLELLREVFHFLETLH